MKKIILLFLIITLNCFSQECKFKKNEIDPFTKNKVVQTKSYAIFSEIGRSVTLEFNLDKNIYIDFVYESQSRKVRLINEADKVLFLLNDGGVIAFSNFQYVPMESSNGTGIGGIVNIYKMKLAVTLQELQRINSVKIKSIRIENSDDPIDVEIKDKKAVKVYKLLDCFLKEF